MMKRNFQRNFRRRPPRKPTVWVPTLFNAGLDLTGANSTEFVMLDYLDYGAPVGAAQFGCMIRRVIGDFDVQVTALSTAFQFGVLNLVWAVYTIDVEDLDASILSTTAGNILQTQRVIQLGHEGGLVTESTGTAQAYPHFMPQMKIKFDVRTKVKFKPDEILVFAAQIQQTVVTSTLFVDISGVTRVLIDKP